MDNMKRAVAYCRVSTKREEQESSLRHQQQHWEDVLSKKDNYFFCGVYADKGTSGTKLTRNGYDIDKPDGTIFHQDGFTQMLEDAGLQRIENTDSYKIVKKPKFDYIFTKNTSRFARNVSADAILKKLAENHVYVYFEDLNKCTDNSDDVTIIQVFMTFDETTSRDLSKKVRFGMEQGSKNGNLHVNSKIYGYRYLPQPENRLEIIEAEANVIREIYHLYVDEGLGTEQICRKLNSMGVKTKRGKDRWCSTTILGILKNAKYCGMNDGQKYSTSKPFEQRKLTKVSLENRQEYLKEESDRIPPIISRKLYDKAQEKMSNNISSLTNKGRYNGKSPYAGILKCGNCGSSYTSSSIHHKKDGSVSRWYYCSRHYRYEKEPCDNPSISIDKLNALITGEAFINEHIKSLDSLLIMLEQVKSRYEKLIDNSNDARIEAIQKRISEISDEKLVYARQNAKGIIDELEFTSLCSPLLEEHDKLAKELDILQNNGNAELIESIAIASELIERFSKDRCNYANLKSTAINQFTVDKCLKEIDSITVYEDGLDVQFKSDLDGYMFVTYHQKLLKTLEK